jgi:flagellum-specific peptidoglycan hydrolase FlgJ
MKIKNNLTAKNLSFIALVVLVIYILNLANKREFSNKRIDYYFETESSSGSHYLAEKDYITEKDLANNEPVKAKAVLCSNNALDIKIEKLKANMFKGVKISNENRRFIEGMIKVSLEEQQRFGIPASIKIAQAIIESGWGRDGLAKSYNNYYGIKHKSYYTEIEKELVGMPVLMMTHEYNKSKQRYNQRDNFISYETRWCSIRHHSIFLKDRIDNSQKPAYKRIKKLSVYNYKAWAINLQKAGYATSPTYANKLVYLIERYNLHKIDLLTK